MSRIIYNIENRGDGWIYHWFCYMICGFRHIFNSKPIRDKKDWYIPIEQNANLYNQFIKFDYPYNLHFINLKNLSDFQSESLKIINKYINIIKDEEIKDDDIIIYNYGEDTTLTIDSYLFLRNLYLNCIDIKDYKLIHKFNNNNFYICRSKSHLCPGNKNENNICRRQILNEIELINILQIYSINCIFLEDYTVEEKIKIFANAKLIISPNSGGLLFSLFSDTKINIIEINTQNPHQEFNQYQKICNNLNLNHKIYNNVIKNDHFDNMTININDFIKFLQNNLLI